MSDVDEDPQHCQHQAVDDVAGRLFVIWTVDGIHGKAFLTQIKGPEVETFTGAFFIFLWFINLSLINRQFYVSFNTLKLGDWRERISYLHNEATRIPALYDIK